MKTELTSQEKLEKVLEAYYILEEYVCEVNNYDFDDNEGTKEMIDYANKLVEEATR